nr:cell division protein ZapA [Anaerobacterium chartisolvens]
MAGKNKVHIRIGGKDYTLVGIEAEEYIQRVGLYIDKKINEITRSNSLLSTSMASILAAVNVADDFFKSRENEKRLEDELERACEELEKLRHENERLLESNSNIISRNTLLQLELAKREAELSEVRASLERTSRKKESGYEEG